MTFTYKTHIFGGTEQGELDSINPFIAPITKISTEIHSVPYIERDSDNILKNDTGTASGGVGTNNPNSEDTDIPAYFKKLDDGKIPYPEYEQLDWIMDWQKNETTGEYELPYDPNEPYGYEIEKGDGLTYVNPRHRLYDQEVEITPDHMKQTIASQNYVNQWGLPYKPIETIPWSDINGDGDVVAEEPTEEELQSRNPMGTDDYTAY